MTSNRSSTSSDDSGWHPAPMTHLSQNPITKPEEIQIVLLGAPGTGKTRLQARYTLRQFVGIDSHGMGGHKHLQLPDGTDVHLIIHELRTGRVWGTKDSTSEEERHQEDCQRKRLLEQSDAVMLLFNPWSKASYEWISGKIIQDVLYTGRKKQLTSDIVRLLDGLAAAMPKRTLSNRSARSARSGLSFNTLMKKLPRRPDDADSDSESEFSFFSDEKDEKISSEDRMDYHGELKRISIVVEGSALKKAEFMIHEKDLPSPPFETIRPLSLPETTSNTRLSRMLPTIREVDESSRKQQRVAVMMDRRHLPIMKHDSMISLQSASSSAYSETTATVVDTNYAAELSDTTHPIYRDSNTISETVVDETTGRPTYQRSSSRTPTGETEMPVLVVATMVDKLKDKGGSLDRHVTPHQGQQLARKFGPNCAYIETSAKTNANVDEAYGIIVDQVMAKRAAARRDEIARARIEAAIAAVQADPPSATRAMPGPRATRSCMPQWTWLDNLFARLPSWETVSEKVSRVFETSGGDDQSREESPGIVEDVWGEEVVKKVRHSQAGTRNSKRNSKGLSETPNSERLSQRKSQSVPLGMGSRTMSHDPTRDTTLNAAINEMAGEDAMEMSPAEEKTQGASQGWVIMPDRPDMMSTNPFEKDEFKRPMNMVTVTTLEPKTPTEAKQQRYGTEILQKLKRSSSFKSVRRASNSEARKSRVGERAPSLPPLTFDAIIIDDKRASVSVLVRSADQERNDDTIEQFLTQDATRDSMVVMLSPTTATRTLSAFVKEINSSRANKDSEDMETAKVVPVTRTTKESRRASEGLPEVAPLMPTESEIEKRVKRVTSPNVLPVELPADDEDFLTVMGLGTAGAVGGGEPSLAATINEPLRTSADKQTSSPAAAAVVVESPAPVSDDKVLPATPPPSLQTKPSTTQKNSPPTTPSSPATIDNNNNNNNKNKQSSVPPLPLIPETLRTPPAAVLVAADTKDSSSLGRAAIVTTTEVHGSESSGDEWPKRPAHPRTPPNPRRARIRTKDGKKPPPPARPARPQRSGTRPVSAWI